MLVPTPDSEQTKGLAATYELGQRWEEVRVPDASSDFCYPNGEMTKEREGLCVGPESRGSDAVQLARQTESLELVPVGKNLVERIPLEDTADVEVREVPYRNDVRGVNPRAMLDGQRPDFSLGVLEELVEA